MLQKVYLPSCHIVFMTSW